MASLSEQLTEAKNSLTPANWRRGSFFKKKGELLCMCAHGAVQAQVNPIVKERLSLGQIGCAAAATAGCAAAAGAAWYDPGKSLQESFFSRPSWISSDSEYGNKDAHYLLGMFGLTTNYNDSVESTFADIHDKFDQAIAFAKELGI